MKFFRSFFIFSAFLILLGACEEDVENQIADLEAFVSRNPVHKGDVWLEVKGWGDLGWAPTILVFGTFDDMAACEELREFYKTVSAKTWRCRPAN